MKDFLEILFYGIGTVCLVITTVVVLVECRFIRSDIKKRNNEQRVLKFLKLKPNAKVPTRGSLHSAGHDLYACLEESVVVKPNETVKIPTGFALEIPNGYVGLIFARSGLATKKGIALANKVGVCDSDYRGEYVVALKNSGSEVAIIDSGDRIAQLVVMPVLDVKFSEVEALSETGRGEGGFGSTGV